MTNKKCTSLLDAVANDLPPWQQAQQLQQCASEVGFDWPHINPVFAKLAEEIEELRHACAQNDQQKLTEELGDVLFACFNLARWLKIEAATALETTNRKFRSRFLYIEQELNERDLDIRCCDLAIMEELWNEAKMQGS